MAGPPMGLLAFSITIKHHTTTATTGAFLQRAEHLQFAAGRVAAEAALGRNWTALLVNGGRHGARMALGRSCSWLRVLRHTRMANYVRPVRAGCGYGAALHATLKALFLVHCLRVQDCLKIIVHHWKVDSSCASINTLDGRPTPADALAKPICYHSITRRDFARPHPVLVEILAGYHFKKARHDFVGRVRHPVWNWAPRVVECLHDQRIECTARRLML